MYFKVFHMFNSTFLVPVLFTGASIIMGLHYCHIMFDVCEVNSVLRVFFRVLLFEKYFFLFSVSGIFGSFRNNQLR